MQPDETVEPPELPTATAVPGIDAEPAPVGINDASTAPHRELLVAVLRAAIRDLNCQTRRHRQSAAWFLATNARDYADLLGLPAWLPRMALELHADSSILAWLREQGVLDEGSLTRGESSAPDWTAMMAALVPGEKPEEAVA